MSSICEVIGARKYFGAVQALRGIDLSINDGEILGIVGPNGSGKTTLFNCITGYLPLTKGQIVWLGEDATHWPMHEIARRGLARTFQQSMYFPSATVSGNLEMALAIAQAARDVTRNERWTTQSDIPTTGDGLVSFVGLEKQANMMSAGLPHGQLRLLGIAIALATRPRLLLLDEPAAGLNDQEGTRLADLLRRVRAAGTAIAVVDHDMAFVMSLVDRVVVLNLGEKLCEGVPNDVRIDPKVVEVYIGAPLEKRRGRKAAGSELTNG